MTKLNKKIITVVVVFAVLLTSFSPIFTRKAEAQYIDIWQMPKEGVLDTIAFLLINKIIERISASTVNWINSGFQGSPAYVTDPGSYFTNIGDQLAGQYIFSNPDLNFLCGPINAKIRLALTKSYLNEPNFQCTLTDAFGDMEDFLGDFNKGGWDKFFQMTQKQQNNPLGAFLQAESQLDAQIASRQGIAKDELNWGQGFMSFKSCDLTISPDGNLPDGSLATGLAPGDCVPGHESTQTPGSVINDQLNQVLGSGGDRLEASDEINEIIGALLTQVISNVVGGVGSGLRGLSQSPASGGAPTTRQLLENSLTSTTDYFGNTVNSGTLPNTVQPKPTVNVRPIDRDCSSLTDTTLYSIAQALKTNFENGTPFTSEYSSTGQYAGEDLSLIIQNMDCPPAGINLF